MRAFVKDLRGDDHVLPEVIGNTAAIVLALLPYVSGVVVAISLQVRLIAEAKVKTDRTGAAVLVDAASAAGTAPGTLRAFFLGICQPGGQRFASVATARKLAVIVWHLLRASETSPGIARRSLQSSGARSNGRPVCQRKQAPRRASSPTTA